MKGVGSGGVYLNFFVKSKAPLLFTNEDQSGLHEDPNHLNF